MLGPGDGGECHTASLGHLEKECWRSKQIVRWFQRWLEPEGKEHAVTRHCWPSEMQHSAARWVGPGWPSGEAYPAQLHLHGRVTRLRVIMNKHVSLSQAFRRVHSAQWYPVIINKTEQGYVLKGSAATSIFTHHTQRPFYLWKGLSYPFRLLPQPPLAEWLINNRHFFLPVLEAKKSKIKAPSDSVSGESPLPGS